jgi:hypothetical protein
MLRRIGVPSSMVVIASCSWIVRIVASNRIYDQPDDGLEKKAETCSFL